MLKTNSVIAIAILFYLFLLGCSSTKSMLSQGSVNPTEFYAKKEFFTVKSIIVIPCEIDGVTKNFIYDTGAQVSSVQREHNINILA